MDLCHADHERRTTPKNKLQKLNINNGVDELLESVEKLEGPADSPHPLRQIEDVDSQPMSPQVKNLVAERIQCCNVRAELAKLACLIFIIILFIVLSKFVFGRMLKKIATVCEKIGNLPAVYRYSNFCLILILYQILPLPAQTTFVLVMAYILEDYIASMLILYASVAISGSITFIASRYLFSECLNKKYKDSYVLRIIKEDMKERMHITNIAVRLMYIPAAIKNHSLVISGATYWVYILWYFVAETFFGLLLVSMGISTKKHGKQLSIKDFRDASIIHKINLIVLPLSILLTATILIAGYAGTKVRIYRMRIKDRDCKAKLHKQKNDDEEKI